MGYWGKKLNPRNKKQTGVRVDEGQEEKLNQTRRQYNVFHVNYNWISRGGKHESEPRTQKNPDNLLNFSCLIHA